MSGVVSTMDATRRRCHSVDLNVVGDIVGGLVEVLIFWVWGDDFGDGVVLFVVVGVVGWGCRCRGLG